MSLAPKSAQFPTPLLPTSPTSRSPNVSESFQWYPRPFANMPPTPEFSPITTNAAPFQPLVVGGPRLEHQPELKPAPEPEPTKPRTIVLCFDGTGNKFGEVHFSSVGESIYNLVPQEVCRYRTISLHSL